MDLTEAITLFGGQFGLGMYPIAPKPEALGGFVPDLSSINKHRDPLDVGVIMQPQNADCTILDGGDSSQKTGMAAFCGSPTDKGLLPQFEDGGIMVRHPNQEPWNNWKNCTRDQLVSFTAGCWRAGRTDIVQRLYTKHAERLPRSRARIRRRRKSDPPRIHRSGIPLAPMT